MRLFSKITTALARPYFPSVSLLQCKTARRAAGFPLVVTRTMASTPAMEEKFAPAKRVAGQKQDVWWAAEFLSLW